MRASADTQGWDTVYALHIDDANAAIRAMGRTPESFAVERPSDRIAARGRFGPWRITRGGSGRLINMALPLQDLRLSVLGQEHAIPEATVDIMLHLEFLSAEGQERQEHPHVLVAAHRPDAAEGAAVVQRILLPEGASLDFLAEGALRELLAAWLAENLAAFDHVFASVDIGGREAEAGDPFAWLRPTHVSYAYADIEDAEDGVLGVLCMTEGRSADGLAAAVSPGVLPPGRRAAFVISARRMMERLLLPAMTRLFDGARASDFMLSESGRTIHASRSGIPFSVRNPETGETHSGTLEALTVEIVGHELRLETSTRAEVLEGYHAICRTENRIALRLGGPGDAPEKRNAILFECTHQESEHDIDSNDGIKASQLMLGVAALFAAGVLIAMSDGLFAVVAVAVIAASGLYMLADLLIRGIHVDDAPKIDALILGVSARMKWTGVDAFSVEELTLADALHFLGRPAGASA